MPPAGWQNPINVLPGQLQQGVDARLLLPSRQDLSRARLRFQRALKKTGTKRATPILVTPDGVIFDRHHAVRAAAEDGQIIDVIVVADQVPPSARSILDLPVC
jgi:hypothetical protein